MTSANTQPAGALDRLVSIVASMRDVARRIGYNRADLRKVPPVEMISGHRSLREAFRWIPEVRIGRRSHAALICYPGSVVSYDVTLPTRARVLTWCAVAPEPHFAGAGAMEFEVRVLTADGESASRCLVDTASSRQGRWHSIRVDAPADGPARIVFKTRTTGDSMSPQDVPLLWAEPRIEGRRSVSDLVRASRAAIGKLGLQGLWYRALPASGERLYRLWIRDHRPSAAQLRAEREWSLGRARTFSLISAFDGKDTDGLLRAVASLTDQTYQAWEAVVVTTDDALLHAQETIARITHDERVRVVAVPSSTTRSDAWNRALGEARGEFAALLGQNDMLAPSALYEIAIALERLPVCDVLYTDEDCVSRASERHNPRFKPDWSPELLLASNYIGRLAVIRVIKALAVGGFRNGHDGAEEWDLLLRLSRTTQRIQRIPCCLYHRDDAHAEDRTAGCAVLQDHCAAMGWPVTITRAGETFRIGWNILEPPLVSIVVPNRNAKAIFEQCANGVLHRTHYRHLELIVVDNASTDPETIELYRSLERDGRTRIVPFNRPFNFSAACNAGAAASRGDLLLFLNNDIEVIDPDWLDELAGWAQMPEIGIVGAKLLYPDRTIQHAGVVFGIGLVSHIFARAPEGTTGLFGSCETYRNYLAVTAACQMMRKSVYQRLGGFDERYGLAFSDVVLCMEAWRAGYRVVYTPRARLMHHESYSRKRSDSPQDIGWLARYLHETGFMEDRFFHPELNPNSTVPALRPPFDPAPRQVVHDYVERVLALRAH